MQNARRVRTDTERKRKREWGELVVHWRLCPGLDAEAPLGVTAALSGAVWRAGWPSTSLIVPQVEETRKPLDLLCATVQTNKARPPIIS